MTVPQAAPTCHLGLMSRTSPINVPTTFEEANHGQASIKHAAQILEDNVVTSTSSPVHSDDIPDTDPSDPTELRGRPQKWRRLTRDDRQVAKSLEQIENDDLSIHLHNAYAIKRNTYQVAASADEVGLKISVQSKDRWKDPKPWRPKDGWTEWPLTPIEVPKYWETHNSNDGPDSEGGNVVGAENILRPSAEMQNMLCAEMVTWSRKELHAAEHLSTALDAASAEQGFDQAGSENEEGKDYSSQDGSTTSQQLDTDGELTEGGGGKDTVVESAESSVAGEPSQSSNNEGYLELKMTDSSCSVEEADKVFQPTARHILQSFDELLMALHHTRQNQTASKQFAHDSDASQESTSSNSSLRQISGKQMNVPAPQKRSSRRYRTREAGLRDWSEILGTAGLIGWNTTGLERTAKRCSNLFDEHMSFKTIENEQPSISYSASRQHGLLQVGASRPEQFIVDVSVAGNSKPIGWICPENTCKRHKKPITRRQHWLLHIKKKHGYEYNGPELLARPSECVQWELGQYVQYCPDPKCVRHKKPYRERWRLREHIKVKHGVRLPSLSRSRSRGSFAAESSSQGSNEDQDEDETVGGVHVDGFLKPVSVRVLDHRMKANRKQENSHDTSGEERSRKRKRHEDATGRPMHTSDG